MSKEFIVREWRFSKDVQETEIYEAVYDDLGIVAVRLEILKDLDRNLLRHILHEMIEDL